MSTVCLTMGQLSERLEKEAIARCPIGFAFTIVNEKHSERLSLTASGEMKGVRCDDEASAAYARRAGGLLICARSTPFERLR
jgi:hypothetical protein